MKKLVVFDLDGTLAQSKSALDDEMAKLLAALSNVAKVSIISGGDWPQFEKQVLGHLPSTGKLEQFYLLPTCGTKFFEYKNGAWQKLYSEDLSPEQKKKITSSLEQAVKETGFQPKQTWGELIEDRGSQITYSALGQQAPLDAKKTYDPDFEKRKKIKAVLDKLIPEFSVALGGSTSVDVTLPGIDKAYGMHKLKEVLKIDFSEMLFVGDALFPGGNDYPARTTGTDCVQVRDPEETKRVIETVVDCLH